MKLRNTFHNTEVDVKMTREEMDRIEHAVYSGRATDAEMVLSTF